jgi:hypothetical protein
VPETFLKVTEAPTPTSLKVTPPAMLESVADVEVPGVETNDETDRDLPAREDVEAVPAAADMTEALLSATPTIVDARDLPAAVVAPARAMDFPAMDDVEDEPEAGTTSDWPSIPT